MPTKRKKICYPREIKNWFLLTAAVIFVVFDLVLAFYIISWNTTTSMVLYIILSTFLFTFSIKFTKKLFSIFVKPYKLYRLKTGLSTHPKVAILYSTMNDVLPECLSVINQTYPCDVFVLDDSSLLEKRKIIDKISREKGFKVLRRSERKGFKAGAINNWINLYGRNYDYIVLLDSDSFVPKDWVENALEYAENPLNEKIAIFQGLINIWNMDNIFIRTLSSLHKIGQDEWELKLANRLDAVFCYGHNVIIRMKPVLEVGGFVEGYVSEDFATAVKLAEHGYKSRFVPLHTYEAMPENIRGFIKRQNKWTRGSMEFLSFIKNSSLSLIQKILLLTIPLGHFSYVGILIAMFLTVFGYMTSFGHLSAFLQNLIVYNIYFLWSIPIFRFAIIIQTVSMAINLVKFKQLGIKFSDFLRHETLSKAIGAIMMPYELKSMINYVIRGNSPVPVTPKQETRLNFKDILSISKITIVLSCVFLLGLFFINPLGLFFNISWLIPFVCAPITLYLYSSDKLTMSNLVNDGGSFSDTGINSDLSQINETYSYIRKKSVSASGSGLSRKHKRIIFALLSLLLVSLVGAFLYLSFTGFFIYRPSAPITNICGNGICEQGEDASNCPVDCEETAEPVVLAGGIKLTDPKVIGPYSDPKEIYVDRTIKLEVSVEKLGEEEAYKIWANVKSPSGALETVSLSSHSDTWDGSLTVKEYGVYEVTFNAIDTSETYTDPVKIAFLVKIFVGSFGAPSAGIPPSAY